MKPLFPLGLHDHHRHAVSAVVAWLVTVICLLAAACARAEPPRPLLIGSETGFAPYADVDSSGHAVGFSVELFSAVARVMAIPIEYRVSDWDHAWNGLLQGELDALPFVARLKEREALFEYTSTHTVGYDCFFVRKGASHLAAIDAARGRRIIVMRSDAAHHALAERGFTSELVFTDSLGDALRMLAAGQNDAVLAPLVIGNKILREHDLGGLEAGPPLQEYRREFAFAVQKGNTALRDRLDQGLLILKTNGEYQKIYDHWLGIYQPSPFPVKYLAWGGGGVSLVLLLFGIWNLALRRGREHLRQSREQLRESRDYLENLFNAASVPIIVWDTSSRITMFNHAFEQLSGRSADAVIGQPIEILVPPDSREQALAQIKATATGPRWESVEIPIQHVGGEIRIVLWNSTTVYSTDHKNLVAVMAQGMDITERKQADAKLAEQLDELRRWHEATSGREGRILELKHEVNELLGSSGQPPRYPSAESQEQKEE